MTCKPRRGDGLLAGGNEGLKCPSRAYSTFYGSCWAYSTFYGPCWAYSTFYASTPISVPKKKGDILSDVALCVYDIEEIA